MSDDNKPVLRDRCDSCKKKKPLKDFGGLLLCKLCEDEFNDELIKGFEKEEFGRDQALDKEFRRKK